MRDLTAAVPATQSNAIARMASLNCVRVLFSTDLTMNPAIKTEKAETGGSNRSAQISHF
jgi:hypothetical protein